MSLYHGPQNIITNGLRLYLDSSRPDSYPGYGDKWYDLSGNDFHGYVVKTSDYPIFNTNYLTFNKTSSFVIGLACKLFSVRPEDCWKNIVVPSL